MTCDDRSPTEDDLVAQIDDGTRPSRQRRAPLIGISTYRERARWTPWETQVDLLPTTYAQSVIAAGGLPVLLPSTPPHEPSAAAANSRLDGLIIAGGPDVDPGRYDEPAHPTTGVPRTDRDAGELALLAAADDQQLPTLGVCRGMQLMAVSAGASLHQHLPDVVKTTMHAPSGNGFGNVAVRIAPGSRLASALRETQHLDVRCQHHQAVRSHPGYVPVAWSKDGTLEAMERVGARLSIGVQWHPGPSPTPASFVL